MDEIDSKQAEQTLIDDVNAEGKLEDETHRMDVSIKPNCDIEENGHQYAEAKESVTGEE